jgi:hypothetical protein
MGVPVWSNRILMPPFEENGSSTAGPTFGLYAAVLKNGAAATAMAPSAMGWP